MSFQQEAPMRILGRIDPGIVDQTEHQVSRT
jgi:hypothetical protein